MIPAGLWPRAGSTLPIPKSGLVAWHDAQAITGYADNATINSWLDRSGNANHLSATSSATPRYRDGATEGINGHPCIRIVNGTTACFFHYGSHILSGATAGEIYIVTKLDADPPATAARTGFWYFNPSTFNTNHPWTDGKIYDSWGTTDRKTVGDPTPSLAAMHIWHVNSRSGGWTAYLNGSVIHTTATNTVRFSTGAEATPRIGTSTSTVEMDGLIGEVIVYNRNLTNDEITGIDDYLNARWS